MPPAAHRPRRRSRSRRRARRRSWLWRYRRLLFLLGLLAVTGIAGAAWVISQVPLPAEAFQAQTTFLTDAAGNRLAVLHGGEDRVPVTLAQVPPVVQQAVIAAEDRNFFKHGGVDPLGIVRATFNDLTGKGALQGGSTITQQYVKNTYVGRSRTLTRKIREAIIAIKLERKFDKRTILERYLNTIYFGRGAYGVQAASRAYFGKDIEQLALPEASYLASLIRLPDAGDARRDPAGARARRSRVLRAMVKTKAIAPAQRDEVERMPVDAYVIPRASRDATVAAADKGTPYFVEYVRQELVRRYGEDLVLRGGLRVQTTLDLGRQRAAYDAVYRTLDRAGDPSGALIALDPDGDVVAMVGGRDFAASEVNLAVGSAGGGAGRQGGSAFKPFVLAEAVREGFTVESAFAAPARIVVPKADNGHDWAVTNYEGEAFDRLNLIDATAHSVNTVYAQLVAALGPAKVAEMAHQLGIVSPVQAVPSITLGTQDVSVLEMADAYLTFANDGVHVPPRVITRVTTASGAVLDQPRPERTRVLEPGQADVVNFVLRQVVEHGTGTGADFGSPAAGKTGTTEDFGDAWFVGYTPKLTAAVWMGYAEGQSRPMLDVHGRRVNGGSFPAAIFERFMSQAGRGVAMGDFHTPSGFPGKVIGGNRLPWSPPTSAPAPAPATAPGSTTSTAEAPPTARRPTTTNSKATSTTA